LPTNLIDKLEYCAPKVKQPPSCPRCGKRDKLRRMDSEQQGELAKRLAHMLNTGVLQDAVSAGLEEQGQFRIDTLDLLDALESAGLMLAPRAPES
jgi:hypothetical protein